MRKLTQIITFLIIAAAAVLAFKFAGLKKAANNTPNNSNNAEGLDFQALSNIDFSNIDPKMPEEVVNKQKEQYNQAAEKLKQDPFDFEANMQKASVLYFFDEYEKAIIIYKKLGELRPKNYLSFKGLGDCLSQLHKFTEAEKAYLKTLENNPYEYNTYLALAEIYRYHIKDNREKIVKFYEDGIKNLGENRLGLIQAYASQLEEWGEYKKSLEQWKIVSEEFPDNQPIKDKIKELEKKSR